MNPLQSDVYPSDGLADALTVLITVLHALAVAATLARTWLRTRYKQFLWDDGWAVIALCFDLSAAVTAWTLEGPMNEPPLHLDRHAHIVSMWINMVSFATLLWSAKISLLLSPFRTLPVNRQTRRLKIALGIFCTSMWIAINVAELYGCGHDVSWYHGPVIQCIMPTYISYIDFSTTILFMLVIFSLSIWLIRTWRTEKKQKIMVDVHVGVYAICFCLAVIHTVFTFPAPTFFGAVTLDVEGASELVLCNTPTFVAWLWKLTHRGEDLEAHCEQPTRKVNGDEQTPSSSLTWTTVDLEYLPTCSNPTVQSFHSVSSSSLSTASEIQSPSRNTTIR